MLVGVWTEGSAADADASLAELAALAETAGSEVLEGMIQRRDKPDPATYIGSGKAAELRQTVIATGADTVICDGELSPAQLTALEKVVKVKVIDRTALILDIFAQHATSREGKAQVELAQMQYMLPRLRGWGESMSRQAGGRAGGSGGGVGTVEAKEQELAPPVDPGEGSADGLGRRRDRGLEGGEGDRGEPAQGRTREPTVGDRSGQALDVGLDLGQLGHPATLRPPLPVL